MTGSKTLFEKISASILNSLAHTVPVACSSDEFYYFPHIATDEITDPPWDDFSPVSVGRIIHEISASISEINGLKYKDNGSDLQIDKNMLVRFLTTLQEQLTEGVFWKKQPSFYLTLMNAGLAGAISSGDDESLRRKAKALPEFLAQAIMNIEDVPYPWIEISLSMIMDCRSFIYSLKELLPGISRTMKMLDNLENKLREMDRDRDFRIPDRFLEKMYSQHLATSLRINQIMQILKDEIDEMWEIMVKEAGCLLAEPVKKSKKPGDLIRSVYNTLIHGVHLQDDLVTIFRNEVDRIKEHLVKTGIISGDTRNQCPVHVRNMPDYFRAIRSASSYAIYPKYPPAEGVFYVLNTGRESQYNITEHRMLTAHETYPGHHLLDSSRLSLENMIRRSLEFPVFYEGWACFAEVLLDITGYFTESADRFILAKRRFWRAIRGRVDILLQTKRIDFEEAASILNEAGIPEEHALASAKIYTLNPGYQVCYTIGIRKFIDLYEKFCKGDIKKFVWAVINGGEVLFNDLERRLEY